MAIDTYAKLQTEILDTLDRTDLVGDVTEYTPGSIERAVIGAVSKAERRMMRRLQTREFETSTRFATSSGVETVALPADFIMMKMLVLNQSPSVVLAQKDQVTLYGDYQHGDRRAACLCGIWADVVLAPHDRSAIADAVFNADAVRGLGSLVSGLRQTGFNTAAALGQQDANRFLTADQTNASNKFAADTFSNNLTNNRQQFSVNEALQGDQNRMQALRDIQNNVLAQSGIQQGGIGNLMQLLSTGTATFGNQSDGTTHTDTYGKSSGKNGGVSLP